MTLMLIRWTDGLGERFELTETQRAEVRNSVPKRWARFLNENRSSIQPLANEYLELHMDLAPPSPDRVRDWATRALPVFERFRAQIEEGVDDFRKILEPSQTAKFEAKALELAVGLQLAQRKLVKWGEGEFAEREFWTPPRTEQPIRRDESATPVRKESGRTATGGTGVPEVREDQIEFELHAWDAYVSEYIRDFKFDRGQQTAAHSCLKELKGRARAHRDRFREEILKLERQIRSSSGDQDDLNEVKEQLVRLYGPVDEMFHELKRRTEQIATTVQRTQIKPKPERQN